MKNIEYYFYPLIKGIGVGSTAGTEPVLLESQNVFSAGISGLPLPIKRKTTKTGITSCTDYQLIRSGKLFHLFSVFGKNRKRWQERQLVRFCGEYSWLRTNATNSLFELEGGYVAVVTTIARKLKIEMRSLMDNSLWSGQAQINVYQLSNKLS